MTALQHFPTLREANIARDIEWGGGRAGSFPLWFRALELGGETGELLELLGVLYAGHTVEVEALTDEIADVAICLDLLSMDLNIAIEWPATGKEVNQSGLLLGGAVGQVLNAVKKIERERMGFVGSRATRDELIGHITLAADYLAGVATARGYSIDEVIADKFNKTSAKYGLSVRMTH